MSAREDDFDRWVSDNWFFVFLGFLAILMVSILVAAAMAGTREAAERKAWDARCVQMGGIPNHPYRSDPVCLKAENVLRP